MSKKANPTVIGGFVLGAIALAVVGVAFFGGGDLFAERYSFVGYFDGSMKGLNIGAPVTFRGIKIGSVKNIVVRYDSKDQSIRIPVYFEIDPGRIEPVQERSRNPEQNIRALIDEGLRAQLVMQSFVTGQIAVELNFSPGSPAVYVGADPTTFEFPTVSSSVERMGKALEDFDLRGLLDNLSGTMKGANELANSQRLRDAIASLDDAIKDIAALARNIDSRVDPLARNLDETVSAARQTLEQASASIKSVEDKLNPALESARKLIGNIDGQVHPIVNQFLQTADVAQHALRQAADTLAAAKRDLGEDSEAYRGLVEALEELAGAARSVRVLSDLLERHPEVLLQGKKAQGVN